MPRFFFHVVDGQFLPDADGTECASAEEAKGRAVVAAGGMLKEQGKSVWRTGSWHMFVCDEQNNTRFKLSFEAVDLAGEMS